MIIDDQSLVCAAAGGAKDVGTMQTTNATIQIGIHVDRLGDRMEVALAESVWRLAKIRFVALKYDEINSCSIAIGFLESLLVR